VTAFHVVIPARFAAARFPGKLLVDLDGVPVLRRVVDVANASGAASVHVAADDRIADWCESEGIPHVRTRAHPSGTDRVAEAARALGLDGSILNVQGDAPLTAPASIRAVADALAERPQASMATLAVPSTAPAGDPNRVAVHLRDGWAVGFERGAATGWRHVGLYAFRPETLQAFAAAPPTDLERQHRLEQLRAYALGWSIAVATGAPQGPDIDTPEDVAAARAWLRSS
jgi:3-deoxy-manno-octulosonate cytidylyltransferase (CMP-KDO synthetase)